MRLLRNLSHPLSRIRRVRELIEAPFLSLPGFTGDLPSRTNNFRTVLHTGLYHQVVLMTIPPKGDIGEEVRALFQYVDARDMRQD